MAAPSGVLGQTTLGNLELGSRGNPVYPRTVTDTTSLSESVARSGVVLTRAATDTTSLVESAGRPTRSRLSGVLGRSPLGGFELGTAVGVGTLDQTLTENTHVSDSVGRNPYRTVQDFTFLTDLVQRTSTTKTRTATDVITSSDSVSAARSTRTATDTVSTIDTVSRALVLHRTATDSTSLSEHVDNQRRRTLTDTTTVSDSLSRAAAVYPRRLVDNVTAVDSLVYAPLTPDASFTATVTSGEEPLHVLFEDTSGYNPTAWYWDFGDGTTSTDQNPFHVFAAGTWTVTLQVSNGAGISTTTTTITVTSSTVYVPPGRPRVPLDVAIKVDGVDLTDFVRFSDASFSAAVNGSIGQAKFAVRDVLHDKTFVGGEEVELWIAGILYWRGFLFDITRQYSFDVDDTTDPTEVVRWFLIEAWEINVLLSRRVAWNRANPTKVMTPPSAYVGTTSDAWAEGTGSKPTVKYVLENYTTLPDDGVTFSEVAEIGSPNPDGDANYGVQPTVYQFLNLANAVPNGIFYIRANRSFVLCDVEKATTPFYLSDHPTGSYGVGPRDYSMTSDASKMINDSLVWGLVRDPIVFSRHENSDSIDRHGRWQYADQATLFRQSSVDHRATALVEGNSPTRHGAKDDRIACEATVYQPLFQLGDVVRCEMQVFDEDEGTPFDPVDHIQANLPLRQMQITFPAPKHPMWKLTLTQELDVPWNTYEFVFPPLNPHITTPPPPPPIPPIIEIGGCTAPTLSCNIGSTGSETFDDFSGRSPGADEWGTTSSGTGAWLTISGGAGDSTVNGGLATLHVTTADSTAEADILPTFAPLGRGHTAGFDLRVVFKVSDVPSPGEFPHEILFQAYAGTATCGVEISPDAGSGSLFLTGSGGSDFPDFTDWVANTWYVVRWQQQHQGGTAQAKIWKLADTEPSTWLASRSAAGDTAGASDAFDIQTTISPDRSDLVVTLDSIINGGGSSGIDPACFDATQEAHFYWYRFTFSSDGCGSARGPGYGQTIVAQSNKDTVDFPVGSSWNFAVGLIVTPYDYSQGFGLGAVGFNTTNHLPDRWGPLHLENHDNVYLLGRNGTFTVEPGLEGDWAGIAQGAAADHIPKTMNASGIIDPVGWVPPQPAECQTVYDQPIPSATVPGGYVFKTAYPYVLGSLRVFLNGTEVFTFTESNPSAGEFTYTGGTLTGSDTIEATYIASGSAPVNNSSSYYGPICEAPTIIDETHWKVTYPIKDDGLLRVWLDGFLLRGVPFGDFAQVFIDGSNILSFTENHPTGSKLWVCYTANGAPS